MAGDDIEESWELKIFGSCALVSRAHLQRDALISVVLAALSYHQGSGVQVCQGTIMRGTDAELMRKPPELHSINSCSRVVAPQVAREAIRG